jgi:hypothetical protein
MQLERTASTSITTTPRTHVYDARASLDQQRAEKPGSCRFGAALIEPWFQACSHYLNESP